MSRFLHGSIIVLALVHAAPAWANDASFHGDGASVFAIKEERILMERENITIRFDAEARDHTVQWVATCIFTFRNLTDQPVEVQMGFPDWRAHGDHTEDPWAIRDFTVRVRGKATHAVHKAVEAPGEAPAAPRRMKLDYDAAYTWTVRFAPGERVMVENTYRFGGFSSNGPLSACVWDERPGRLASVFWRRAPKLPGGWDFENCLCRVVSYVVTTGRTWGGPIGVADIAIQLPPNTWPHLFAPLPAATQVDQGWVRWHFERWTPTDELRIVFVRPLFPDKDIWLPLFDTPAQARAWVRFARQNRFGRALVRQMRQAYAFRHGQLDDPALRALAESWGERPEGKLLARLSARDRHIDAILERFEAQLAGSQPGKTGREKKRPITEPRSEQPDVER